MPQIPHKNYHELQFRVVHKRRRHSFRTFIEFAPFDTPKRCHSHTYFNYPYAMTSFMDGPYNNTRIFNKKYFFKPQ